MDLCKYLSEGAKLLFKSNFVPHWSGTSEKSMLVEICSKPN